MPARTAATRTRAARTARTAKRRDVADLPSNGQVTDRPTRSPTMQRWAKVAACRKIMLITCTAVLFVETYFRYRFQSMLRSGYNFTNYIFQTRNKHRCVFCYASKTALSASGAGAGPHPGAWGRQPVACVYIYIYILFCFICEYIYIYI